MSIVRRGRDPRTAAERRADRDLLARFERGEALVVPPDRLREAAIRVSTCNAERRRRVARLGARLGELRRAAGLTQEQVARAIGTSKPNVCAIEHGRAPGISLERFLAILDVLDPNPPRRRATTARDLMRVGRLLREAVGTP